MRTGATARVTRLARGKKSPVMLPKLFFCQNQYMICTSKKVAQKFAIFKKKLSKVNNRRLGENSPNPVTLATALT
jgi:hypothetical protein